jgi:hypothetical protein
MYSNILTGACTHDGNNPPPASLHLHRHPDSHHQPSSLTNLQLLHKAPGSSTFNVNNEKQHNQQSCIDAFKSFWACSKPCGILTLVLGILSIIGSIVCFVVIYGTSYCQETDDSVVHTCSEPMFKLIATVFLIFSIIVIFFGTVIVIYTTRDNRDNIIITTSVSNNEYYRNADHAKGIQHSKDEILPLHKRNCEHLDNQQSHNHLSLSSNNSISIFSSKHSLNKNTPFIDSEEHAIVSS